MSFWPFPTTILDELRAGRRLGIGLEIGSGGGDLHGRLAAAEIELLTVDLRAPARVRGDAMALPFRDAQCGVVVAGNLLRHLSGPARPAFLAEASRVLLPGAALLLLEDEPEPRDAAEQHYREALRLLALADPERGPALDLDDVLAHRPPGLSAPVLDLRLENEERVLDPLAPVRWLESRVTGSSGALQGLRDAVERDGMRYGRFRACLLRRRPGEVEA